jgi:hypothetical protein
MERIGVRQHHRDHHEAGGQERRCGPQASKRREMATSDRTTGTRDEHDNVISVLYHALQGADTCATYLQDAEQTGDQELVQFFREVQGIDRQLGDRGKALLRQRLR